MRKVVKARASVLKEVSARKGGNIFVLASMLVDNQPIYEPKQATASHECAKCGTGFATTAGVSPHCPNCGSGQCTASEDQAQDLPETDEQLSFIPCSECGTANILHDVTAKLMDGQLHCVTCGHGLSFETVQANGGSDPVVMENRGPDGKIVQDNDPRQGNASDTAIKDLVEGDKTGQVNADMNEVQVPTGEGTERPIRDADATDIKTTMEGDALKPHTTVQADQQDPVVEELTDDDLDQDLQQQEYQQDQANVENFGGKQAKPFGKDDQEQSESAVKVSVLSTLMMFKGDKELSFASKGDALLAFVNDQHVATLTAEAAGEKASVMHTPSFAKAVALAAQEEGLKEAFAKYGMSLASVVVPVSKVVAGIAAKRTKAEASRIADSNEEHAQVFMQCMSIAAAGLNKNFWPKEENALKRGFYESLSNAGVRNAEKLIDQVFAKFGEQFSKTQLQLASELMSKPAEVRNAMSEAVQASSYMAVAEDQDEDTGQQEEDSTTLVKSLESAGLSARQPSGTAQTASIHSLRKDTGGSFFQRKG